MALPRKRKGRGNHVVVPFPLLTSIGSYLRASGPPQTSSLLFQPLQPHNSIACLVAPPDFKILENIFGTHVLACHLCFVASDMSFLL